MRPPIALIIAFLCAAGLFQNDSATAFPTLSKDKLIKSFNKEKPPPPLIIRDKWAVLVGLSKYQDPNIAPVKSTPANFAVLTRALKDPTTGRFAEDHVTTLFGQQATKKYVEYLLTEGWLIKKALPNDLVLVYVSGRAAFSDGDAILCSYDTSAASVATTGISLHDLLAEIHRRTQCKNIVCVADLAPLKEDAAVSPDLWKNIANSAKVSILAASIPGQPSYQFNSMGTLFTGYFTDALQNAGGSATLEAIAQFVCQNTESDARTQLHKEEHPQFVLLPENHELAAVAIGVPIKTPFSQSRVAIGHPIDRLAFTRPDLLVRNERSSASFPPEGAKEIPRKASMAVRKIEAAKKTDEEDDDDVQDIDYSAFMTKMKKDIQAKWKPPKGLEQRKVAVTFSINRDGSITNGSVVESSGIESIDKSALDALHDASPLDPLPKGAPKSVQIRYQFDWKVSQ